MLEPKNELICNLARDLYKVDISIFRVIFLPSSEVWISCSETLRICQPGLSSRSTVEGIPQSPIAIQP